MHSWFVWLVFAIACIMLGFIGWHFAVRTLRFVAALFALAVVVVVTRYGVAHHGAGAHADLVNSFTQGLDALSNAFFRPLLGNNNPIPGRIGWLVIIGLLVFGYRELEVWAMCWQPPTVDLSALGRGKPDSQNGSASGGQDKATTNQRHDTLANELRFRLPVVAVRAPAILPGGTKVAGLVSIAESTGNTAGGLAGAIINFVGTFWPNPRQYQIGIRVEPSGNKDPDTPSVSVTVDLENSRTGGSIATKTLAVRQFDEASCVVAGYVARQIFSADPTAPPWCYGSFDGSDLAAILSALQVRVPASGDIPAARSRRIAILEKGASSSLCAGVTRYELAQLHDIDGSHVEALRLHAINREQYPRFYRGRYRLGMSLEMLANPEFKLDDKNPKETLCECLDILDRCRVTHRSEGRNDDVKDSKLGEPLPRSLRMELLMAARDELCAVRRQLAPCRLIWAALVHRDERAIWKHYWRLADRERFHDGVRVAELLVAVRRSLNEKEDTQPGSSQGSSVPARDGHFGTEHGQPEGGRHSKVSYYLRKVMNIYGRVMNRYNLARAEWITAAITGEKDTIKAVLKPEDKPQPAEDKAQPAEDKAQPAEDKAQPAEDKAQPAEDKAQPRRHAQRTRWVPWQHRTPSWQAAYNTACLYAALADMYDNETMARRVVTSLTRAINDRHCEMGRPSDWIHMDPDFSSVQSSPSFRKFFNGQKTKDYPEEESQSEG
jgi:hypothetical protein